MRALYKITKHEFSKASRAMSDPVSAEMRKLTRDGIPNRVLEQGVGKLANVNGAYSLVSIVAMLIFIFDNCTKVIRW